VTDCRTHINVLVTQFDYRLLITIEESDVTKSKAKWVAMLAESARQAGERAKRLDDKAALFDAHPENSYNKPLAVKCAAVARKWAEQARKDAAEMAALMQEEMAG
jgi:glycerol-3-phosphate O-acyltransferase